MRIQTQRYEAPAVSLADTVALVRTLLDRAGVPIEHISGVGVGIAGLVDPSGVVINSIILPEWSNVDVVTHLSSELQARVVVQNDATMAAVGHWMASRRDDAQGTLVCLTLGTGVGAAILQGGVPLRGPDGTAGQLGHLAVEVFGRRCSCGSSGCLNAYVSGEAIAERYCERAGVSRIIDPPDSRRVLIAAREGDPDAREVLEETSLFLGAGLASIVNALNPEVIALCGGVSEMGDQLLIPAREHMYHRAFRRPAKRVRVQLGAYGSVTGAVGAAFSAAESPTPGVSSTAVAVQPVGP